MSELAVTSSPAKEVEKPAASAKSTVWHLVSYCVLICAAYSPDVVLVVYIYHWLFFPSARWPHAVPSKQCIPMFVHAQRVTSDARLYALLWRMGQCWKDGLPFPRQRYEVQGAWFLSSAQSAILWCRCYGCGVERAWQLLVTMATGRIQGDARVDALKRLGDERGTCVALTSKTASRTRPEHTRQGRRGTKNYFISQHEQHCIVGRDVPQLLSAIRGRSEKNT